MAQLLTSLNEAHHHLHQRRQHQRHSHRHHKRTRNLPGLNTGAAISWARGYRFLVQPHHYHELKRVEMHCGGTHELEIVILK